MRFVKQLNNFAIYCAESKEEKCSKCGHNRFFRYNNKKDKSLVCTRHKQHIK